MRGDSHPRRFNYDPRWLLPAPEAGPFASRDEPPLAPDDMTASDPSDSEFAEAIEQIYRSRSTICPGCGSVVPRDRSRGTD
jgi:hypothetical protein